MSICVGLFCCEEDVLVVVRTVTPTSTTVLVLIGRVSGRHDTQQAVMVSRKTLVMGGYLKYLKALSLRRAITLLRILRALGQTMIEDESSEDDREKGRKHNEEKRAKTMGGVVAERVMVRKEKTREERRRDEDRSCTHTDATLSTHGWQVAIFAQEEGARPRNQLSLTLSGSLVQIEVRSC